MPKLSKQEKWLYGLLATVVGGLLIALFKWGAGTIYDNVMQGQADIKKTLEKVQGKQEETLSLVGENSGRLIKVETILKVNE